VDERDHATGAARTVAAKWNYREKERENDPARGRVIPFEPVPT
jgi:hypothetical protein